MKDFQRLRDYSLVYVDLQLMRDATKGIQLQVGCVKAFSIDRPNVCQSVLETTQSSIQRLAQPRSLADNPGASFSLLSLR